MLLLGRLGRLERRVMEVAWRSQKPLSVHDVHEAIDRVVAYTTVMTTLDRLYKKGLLSRDESARAYAYSARMPRHRVAMQLVSNLVEDIGQADAALLDELERFIEEKRRKLER